METVECVVIGAGVIGLAAARELALAGREVIVLEAEDRIGSGTSSRNSEVIHAGIYYPKSSVKARTCVAGRRALYDYCADRGVPHRRVGKLIVACSEAEVSALEEIRVRAAENGLVGEGEVLELLGGDEAMELEPALTCRAALLSPATGIIDSHALMLSFQGEVEAAGGVIALRTPVLGGEVTNKGFEVSVDGADPTTLACRISHQ